MALKQAIRRRLDPLLERFAPRWRSVAALRRRAADARADAVAVPPESLIRRSGWTPGSDVVASYLRAGIDMKELLSALVADAPSPVRVLDFGCGVAKTLRHFAAEGTRFELNGCDIDGPSIDWLVEHHSSYASFALLQETPGLPYPDGRFDLAYAVSVFTHITEGWAGWLLELRRVLAPDGLLVVTVLGEAMIEAERGGVWEEDAIGMNVLRHGQDWEGGGPTVFLSQWWIREHWGRAFEILEIRESRHPDGSLIAGTHDTVIMRPRPGSLRPADLERLDPGEPRELRALQRNIAQLHADDAHLRALLAEARARGDSEHDQRVELARQLDALRAQPPPPAE